LNGEDGDGGQPTGSFQCQASGKLLKIASPPAATEVVQVKT
jgi:hypothetical protein